jgi:hypothetical protein
VAPDSDLREAAAAITIAEFVEPANLLKVLPLIAEEPLVLKVRNSLKSSKCSEQLAVVSTTDLIVHFAW